MDALIAAAATASPVKRASLPPLRSMPQQTIPPTQDEDKKRVTAAERAILEEFYLNNPRSDMQTRNDLAKRLGLPPRKLQIWLQNRAQKDKKAARIAEAARNLPKQQVDANLYCVSPVKQSIKTEAGPYLPPPILTRPFPTFSLPPMQLHPPATLDQIAVKPRLQPYRSASTPLVPQVSAQVRRPSMPNRAESDTLVKRAAHPHLTVATSYLGPIRRASHSPSPSPASTTESNSPFNLTISTDGKASLSGLLGDFRFESVSPLSTTFGPITPVSGSFNLAPPQKSLKRSASLDIIAARPVLEKRQRSAAPELSYDNYHVEFESHPPLPQQQSINPHMISKPLPVPIHPGDDSLISHSSSDISSEVDNTFSTINTSILTSSPVAKTFTREDRVLVKTEEPIHEFSFIQPVIQKADAAHVLLGLGSSEA